jgi:hypothetical protein
LSIWLDPEIAWEPPPRGKRGRQCQFSDAAIQACLTLKVLLAMPLRHTSGFVESLLRSAGLDWAVREDSTLCRRQRTLNVSLQCRGGTGPLNLLIDSAGIKDEGEEEWSAAGQETVRRTVLTTNAQAWLPETPDMTQDTHRDRRGNTGAASRPRCIV